MKRSRPALLVLGWGNRSRGDDALGPLCVAALRDHLPLSLLDQVEFLEEHQLQIEHALDLRDRQQVLLIDASRDCAAPYEVLVPRPQRDHSYTSHALSPEALLQVFFELQGFLPPPVSLLAIRGQSFELGEALGAAAQSHLTEAVAWALDWCRAVALNTECGARG